MSRTITVGVLLITYRGSADEQPIRWVRLDDFTNLQNAVAASARQAESASRIRDEIARLRDMGVTDDQLAAAGINVAEFTRLATAHHTWPLLSYQLGTFMDRATLGRINRTHQLQTRNITSVRLTQRKQVLD